MPFFYKAVGFLKADTLDNPLLRHYTHVLDHFGGTSLDVFAHTTLRTTWSNQFDITTRTQEPATPGVTHYPLLHPDAPGRADSLDVKLKQTRFQVTLVDPPFTPWQQTQLYGGQGRADLQDLMVDSPESLQQLYQSAWELAVKHTEAAILLYGYKLPPATSHWRLAALWAVGSGAHPTILGALYLHESVAADSEALVATLEERALEDKAEVSEIRVWSEPLERPPAWHVGVAPGPAFLLYPRASEYAQSRRKSDPPAHPTYLGEAMVALSQRSAPVEVHSALAAAYRQSKGRPCFGGWRVKRGVYAPEPWADVLFVLRLKPARGSEPRRARSRPPRAASPEPEATPSKPWIL